MRGLPAGALALCRFFLRTYEMDRFDANPERQGYAHLFSLMRRALRPKPRLVLPRTLAKSAATSAPTAPRRPRPLPIYRTAPSDRELLGGLSDAVARGWISGHDALLAERLVQADKPLPKAIRAAILGRR